MKTENSGKSRMWKDAPAALCEFVGVDPARKWAQCEKERDEWAALAGQYKQERDEAQEIAEAFSALAWKLEAERNEAREDLDEETKFHHRTHSELIQTQCQLLDIKQVIYDTLEENRHLADGDDCTLAKLKSVVPDWK